MAVQEHRRDAYVSGGLLRRFAQARPALLIAAFIFAALVQFVGLAVTPGVTIAYLIVAAFLFGLGRYPEMIAIEMLPPKEPLAHPAE